MSPRMTEGTLLDHSTSMDIWELRMPRFLSRSVERDNISCCKVTIESSTIVKDFFTRLEVAKAEIEKTRDVKMTSPATSMMTEVLESFAIAEKVLLVWL